MNKEIDMDVIKDFSAIETFITFFGLSAMTDKQKTLVRELALSLLPKIKEKIPNFKFHREKKEGKKYEVMFEGYIQTLYRMREDLDICKEDSPFIDRTLEKIIHINTEHLRPLIYGLEKIHQEITEKKEYCEGCTFNQEPYVVEEIPCKYCRRALSVPADAPDLYRPGFKLPTYTDIVNEQEYFIFTSEKIKEGDGNV